SSTAAVQQCATQFIFSGAAQVGMSHDFAELLPVTVELGLIKFALKEFGNDFIFRYPPDLFHCADRCNQRNPDFRLALEDFCLNPKEWDRHSQQKQHHED